MAHLVGGAGAIKSAMLANQGCIDSVASDKVVCTNLSFEGRIRCVGGSCSGLSLVRLWLDAEYIKRAAEALTSKEWLGKRSCSPPS